MCSCSALMMGPGLAKESIRDSFLGNKPFSCRIFWHFLYGVLLLEGKKTIDQIAAADGRYDVRAVRFVFDGLGRTVEQFGCQSRSDLENRHVSGKQLAVGLGELAVQRWGRLARVVLDKWGVKTTRDFGEIVYLMISHGWMSARETDRIEDFNEVFDFEATFERQFRFKP